MNPETLIWLADGSPYNPRFGDVYRTRAGGWAQAQAVFLNGCGLPQAWRGYPSFRILETGFGLGVNFLATAVAWLGDPARSPELHFVSVEAYPVDGATLQESARRLDMAPETASGQNFARVFTALLAAWPSRQTGWQHWRLLPGLHLHLGWATAQKALITPMGPVDAVYLDGFSPRRNPDAWDPPTLAAVAAHCRPGTRLASWCVAGLVRTRLAELGFTVQKMPGLPPKKERLEATFGGSTEPLKRALYT